MSLGCPFVCACVRACPHGSIFQPLRRPFFVIFYLGRILGRIVCVTDAACYIQLYFAIVHGNTT